ncbi:MAG: hypothetical protein ABSD29_17750 [Verrucomicrobiota bacterium]|jgi:hypothetical protein
MMEVPVSNYQDFGLGGRDCSLRYEVIKACLPQDRLLAVLDVGSNMGFFSISIARDFHALVYSIEHQRADYRFHIEELNRAGLSNNYVFKSLLDKPAVERMFRGPEVFDATLLLSVVHHFHYPFDEWAEMVGTFVRASALTFLELPSTEDADDVAAMDKFRSWYSRHERPPYEPLVHEMLKVARLEQCTVATIRGSVSNPCSKETRHILVVRNEAVKPSAPRFHCLPLATSPGLFLVHPPHKGRQEMFHDWKAFCRRMQQGVRNRWRRTSGLCL